jgi:hypothetical protein
MLRRVALVRTDVWEERSASIIRVTGIGERGLLVMANVVPSSPILVALIMEALRPSETSFLSRATMPNIPEDAILPWISSIIMPFLVAHTVIVIKRRDTWHGQLFLHHDNASSHTPTVAKHFVCAHPTTISSRSHSELILAVPYSDNCHQGDTFFDHERYRIDVRAALRKIPKEVFRRCL